METDLITLALALAAGLGALALAAIQVERRERIWSALTAICAAGIFFGAGAYLQLTLSRADLQAALAGCKEAPAVVPFRGQGECFR